MVDEAAIYVAPTPLTSDWAHERIYSAHSYRHLRALGAVPIAAVEAQSLAEKFPVCWRMVGDRVELIILRSLVAQTSGFLGDGFPGSPAILQAYPFVIPTAEQVKARSILVDRVFADQPTDLGAPIMTPQGRMSPGAASRVRQALQLMQAFHATEVLSDMLRNLGLLEPWNVDFDLGFGVRAVRTDLLVVAPERLNDRRLFGLVDRFGVDAGLFLAHQRLSLYRFGVVLAAARAWVRQSRAGATEAASGSA